MDVSGEFRASCTILPAEKTRYEICIGQVGPYLHAWCGKCYGDLVFKYPGMSYPLWECTSCWESFVGATEHGGTMIAVEISSQHRLETWVREWTGLSSSQFVLKVLE